MEELSNIGSVTVSKLITDQGKKPMFMFRGKKAVPEDSGWRIFSGLESDEYVNNAKNIGIYHVSHIIEIEPSIKNLLLKGIGSVFERKNENSEWYKVDDYELEDNFMVEHFLTEKWVIKINNLFEREKEENGDLLYTTGDKSVRIAIWNFEKSKKEFYQEQLKSIENRDTSKSPTFTNYEFSDSNILRIGYKIKEKNPFKEYHVIYGFSIIDKEFIQVALYFDYLEDESWAIETWKNITTIK